MSAYVVSDDHIDALLRAGLVTRSGLRWQAPESREESDYERGEVWGATAVENAQRVRRDLTTDTCNETGRMLLMENVRSVAHRYDETIEEAHPEILTAVFPASRVMGAKVMHYTPVQVLKLISCYEYQSCEHPDWESSEAYAFCQALRAMMISRLPGYDDAPWGI